MPEAFTLTWPGPGTWEDFCARVAEHAARLEFTRWLMVSSGSGPLPDLQGPVTADLLTGPRRPAGLVVRWNGRKLTATRRTGPDPLTLTLRPLSPAAANLAAVLDLEADTREAFSPARHVLAYPPELLELAWSLQQQAHRGSGPHVLEAWTGTRDQLAALAALAARCSPRQWQAVCALGTAGWHGSLAELQAAARAVATDPDDARPATST